PQGNSRLLGIVLGSPVDLTGFWNIPTFLPPQTIHKSAPKSPPKSLNLNDFRPRAESSILSGSTSFLEQDRALAD
ncbi:MAG: hypothetical protein ACXWCH_34755, partial [Burkholderiales bacterium]